MKICATIYLISLLFFFFPLNSSANNCLEGYMADAGYFLDQKDYKNALNTYEEAIKNCYLNAEERTLVLTNLEAIHDTIKAEIEAQKDLAIEARKVAEIATKLAETNRKIAEKEAAQKRLEALRSEARRLAFLADDEQKDQQIKLFLAYEARRLMDSCQSTLPTVLKAFGDAIKENYTQQPKQSFSLLNDVMIHPKGAIIANQNELYFPAKATKPSTLAQHQDHILAILPFKDKILTYSKDHYLKLWSTEGQFIKDLAGHKGAVNFARFSPLKNWIVSGGKDSLAILWNKDGQLIKTLTHQATVYDADFSLHQPLFFTRAGNKRVHLWNTLGKKIKTLPHQSYVYDAIFLHQPQYLVTATSEGLLHYWDYQGNLIETENYKHPIIELIAAPDQIHFLVRFADGSTLLKKGKTATILQLAATTINTSKLPATTFQQTTPIQQALFIPKTSTFLIQSGKKVQLLNFKGDILMSLAHEGNIHKVRCSKDGQYILTTSQDHTAKLWDTKGNLLLNLNDFHSTILDAKFSIDQKSIIAYSKKGKIITCPIPAVQYQLLQKDPPKLDASMRKKYLLEH